MISRICRGRAPEGSARGVLLYLERAAEGANAIYHQTDARVADGDGGDQSLPELLDRLIVEHQRAGEDYFPARLEDATRRVKHEPAAAIYRAITEDLLTFGRLSDDVTLVVIKRV